MKIGIHLSVISKNWDDEWFDKLQFIKECGYDGIEVPLLNPDKFRTIEARDALKLHKLETVFGTGLSVDKDITSNDIEVRNRGIEHLKKCIDIVSECGSRNLNGVLHSPWGLTIDRTELKNRYNNCIASLQVVGDYAKDKGITLSLEMLNRYESSFLNCASDAVELLDKVNHPNIKVHYDTFHANIEEKSQPAAIRTLGNKIGHVHFCENDRGLVGTGSIDFKAIITALKDINYDGWIVVESFVEPSTEVGNGVYIWRKIEKSKEYVAKQSVKNIKELLGEYGKIK